MTSSRQPRISVVIPVHNRIELLRRALDSVAAQDHPDLEIIVVDDGSRVPVDLGPGTPSLPVRVLHNERSVGAQRARLLGAEAATGDFVALLDSDDWWHPDKMRCQAALARAHPQAVVCCRVIAARGSLRREAPWRPLGRTEKVENFLYVHRGMLQSSTVLAARTTMIELLRSSADGRVHNDTMLFLEAQRRGLDILQMPQALSFFDDNPRPDRVSYDLGRIKASEAWFHAVSGGWSLEARRGFMLTDMVTRYVNAGQRRKALRCLLQSFHPGVGLIQYFKKLIYIACGGSPFDIMRVLNRCLIWI